VSTIKRYFTNLNSTRFTIIIGVFIFFSIIVLPSMFYWMVQVTGITTSPDTNLILSLKTYYFIREEYGMIGRRLYIVQRYTFDLVWPFIYTIFLLGLLGALNTHFRVNDRLYILPIIAMIFDFIENILATIFMVVYPETVNTLLYFLMVITIIKWILITVVTIVISSEMVNVLLKKHKKIKHHL
jgi:hypothetical protein